MGSQDDHLYALAPDGRLRWSYATRADADSSPVIGDDGTVYFGSDDDHVYALDPAGHLRWSADVDGYVRAPVAMGQGGTVIACVFGPHPRVVALDGRTGAERWTFAATLKSSTEVGIESGPLVDAKGFIYFGGHDNYLYSLTPEGEMRWIFQAEGDVDAPPVLAPDGTLLVGSNDHRLYALR